ncbi:PKD domain-containing protein [Sphingobacteriales bacterium UPWRP_1]|nr:hypothetical protein B6N25_08155 [Sphingobacteriales bacterium TSM_CSS]PSJ76280.1 PKD domain-containing protein [Sphingobacteriales bacterium UPWRP_1]
MKKNATLFILIFFLAANYLHAQYNLGAMNGQTVIDCQGNVVDSGINGNNPGDYGLNENLSFTVCIPNAVEITISVNQFSTEETHDSLTIYAGTAVGGTILLTLNGDQPPVSLTLPGQASGGIECFTFHFYSDLAVTRPGFDISWDATLQQPPPIPPFSIDGVQCLEDSFLITLPAPILCDYVSSGTYTISGINAPGVAAAIPQNCINGQTTSILLQLDAPITSGGAYGLFFNYSYTDICDDVWEFNAVANFNVSNCPLEVTLPPNYNNCGNCSLLLPEVTGGNGVYNYTWSPPLQEGANVPQGNACPPVSTAYSLTVTDGLGQTATATTFVTVCPFSAILPDASFCEGNCLNLTTLTTGGYPPFTYQWAAANPAAVTNIFTNLATNSVCAIANTTLSVTVTDASGNTATDNANLTVCPMSATVSTSGYYCGSPLPVSVNASGGSGQYNYLWNPPLSEGSTVSGGTVVVTQPALYNVTVTDALTGAIVVISDVLIDLCPFEISILAPDTLCNETGNISAEVSGPGNSYSFLWQPPLNEGANVASGTINISQPTTYNLTVTDNLTAEQLTASWLVNICPLEGFVSVAVYACDSITDVNFCIPVQVLAEGGDGNYSVQWQAPFDTLSGLGPHFICITDTIMPITAIISDGTGSSITSTGWLQNCPFIVTIDGPSSVCDDTGYCAEIEALPLGGTFEYTFAWQPPFDYLAGPGPHTVCFNANTPSPATVSVMVQSGNELFLASQDIAICPYYVDVEIDSLLCPGQSDTLRLDIGGGVPPYALNWSVNSGGNQFGIDIQLPYDPYIVTAPPTATPYSIEFVAIITDANGAIATDTAVVLFNPSPNLPPAVVQSCQDAAAFVLLLPDAGLWEGDNISGSAFSLADAGTFDLTYTEGECSATTQAIVYPTPQFSEVYATCQGGAPFTLIAPPLPGTWSDALGLVNPAGLFTPSAPGVFDVTYTTADGCTAETTVTVQGITLNTSAVQVCNSDVQLFAAPAGGVWSGSAAIFTNAGNTYFSAQDAGAGNYTLYYTLPGNCVDSVAITVVTVDVQDYLQVCPLAAPVITLPNSGLPAGGQWSSASLPSGLVNPVLGTFNPTIQGGNDFTETLTYSYDGCSDELQVDVTNTTLSQNALTICQNADAQPLSGFSEPPGGTWSGNGVSLIGSSYFFNPASVIPAAYQLSYSANGCTSVMNATVLPINAGADIVKCATDATFVIQTISPPNPPGGIWTGTGILPGAGSLGIFDPAIADSVNQIIYESTAGCTDTLTVYVNSVEDITIQGFGTFVCYHNADLPLVGLPEGGTFSGPGLSGNPTAGYTFNPFATGPGPVLLTYQYNNGCNNLEFYAFNVGDSLQVLVPPDTLICLGQGLPVSAFASGGANHNYYYTWDNGLGYGQIHPVFPSQTTAYSVTVTDGCTQPAIGSVMVTVADSIQYTYTTNEPVCYGQEGFIQLQLPPDANYAVEWEHTNTNTLLVNGTAGAYYATITNTDTGCKTEAMLEMPHYPLLYAAFETNENQAGCVGSLQLFFTDFSEGGTTGYWDFGDGTTLPYVLGQEVYHSYALPGQYTVTLYLENEGNCQEVITRNLCIELSNDFVIPNAFSPNGDGKNDVFRAAAIGVENFSMDIYNRLGQLVFTAGSIEQGWNGMYNNKPAEIGVYVYQLNYQTIIDGKTHYLKGNVTLIR